MRKKNNILLLAAAAMSIAAWCSSALAQKVDTAKADSVKSAYLLNFAKFTTWPEDAFAQEDSPLVICVWGRHTPGASLERITQDKLVQGRSIRIHRLEPDASKTKTDRDTDATNDLRSRLEGCHILYVGAVGSGRLADVLGSARPETLTVSDAPGFARSGGMIGLVLKRGRITFEANLHKIEASRVRVSSKILKLATIVRPDHEAE